MVPHSIDTAYLREKAETYDERRFSQQSGQVVHRLELAMLHRVLPYLSSNSTILEVGCGTGRFLVELAKNGYSVDGTDASPDMLSICETKVRAFSNTFEPRLGEAAKIPYPSNTFDLTYCIRLLNQTESASYALDVIQDMFRVTKPGGYTLIEFMNYYRAPVRTNTDQHVLLRPQEVIAQAQAYGGTLVSGRGAFFVNMGVFHMVPAPMLKVVQAVDKVLSGLVPRLCSRCYFLFHKQ